MMFSSACNSASAATVSVCDDESKGTHDDRTRTDGRGSGHVGQVHGEEGLRISPAHVRYRKAEGWAPGLGLFSPPCIYSLWALSGNQGKGRNVSLSQRRSPSADRDQITGGLRWARTHKRGRKGERGACPARGNKHRAAQWRGSQECIEPAITISHIKSL